MGERIDWRGRRVLITGATGFIGRHLVDHALRAHAVVTTLSRGPANIPGTFAHLTLDISDPESTSRAVRDLEPDAILHVASSGVSGKSEFSEMLRSNVLGTDNLLSAVKSLSHRSPVVMAGTGYEYAPQNHSLAEDDPILPASPYGVSKAAATLCAANYSAYIPITILRLFNVYGPGEQVPRLVPYIVRNTTLGEPVELTSCQQIRDFSYVSDIASVFWRALECAPREDGLRIFNVGSGSAMRLKDFVGIVVRVLQKYGMRAQVKFGSRPYRDGEPMYYVANTSRLRKAMDWIPTTPMETGLTEAVAALL
jgi:nucleoside-diphosphate-sugar epimerase